MRTGQLSLRASLVGFLVMTGLVVLGALALILLLDPRTQAFWGSRFSELGTLVRGLLPR